MGSGTYTFNNSVRARISLNDLADSFVIVDGIRCARNDLSIVEVKCYENIYEYKKEYGGAAVSKDYMLCG